MCRTAGYSNSWHSAIIKATYGKRRKLIRLRTGRLGERIAQADLAPTFANELCFYWASLDGTLRYVDCTDSAGEL
jgi:hypothetical protein